MIKAVLFDYGGVITDGGKGIDIARRLAVALQLPETTAHEVFLPLFKQFTRGRIDEQAFWRSVGEQTGQSITDNDKHLWDSWWGMEPYPKMLAVLANLKSAGYQVGLLSNIIPPAKTLIESGGGYSYFDFTILSSEVGHKKPDPEIYQMALARFKDILPEEIVFIDDQQKYLPPAEALGMQTILAESTGQIVSDLRRLGLPV